jgi:hypothetical protein
MHRLAVTVLVGLCLPALHAQAQGLGGTAEAFPSGQPFDALPGVANRLQGAGLPGTEVFRNADGSTTIRGIPLSSDTAARLNRVLGGAMPGTSALGQGMTNVFSAGSSGAALVGQPLGGKVLSLPGVTPAQGGGMIEGASNLISAPLEAVPGMLQGAPLR